MNKEPANKPIVEIVRATKIYPPDVVALENISLSVPYGEILFLTGMSGAGKTTLLKLICGIEHPDKGLIEVAGKDLSRIKDREIPRLRQQIGMAYQDFKLLADRTVAQNIAMAMEVAYHNIRAIKNKVNELLQLLRLEHKHDANLLWNCLRPAIFQAQLLLLLHTIRRYTERQIIAYSNCTAAVFYRRKTAQPQRRTICHEIYQHHSSSNKPQPAKNMDLSVHDPADREPVCPDLFIFLFNLYEHDQNR
jgi:ABC-type sugar transport system ATPase subunit